MVNEMGSEGLYLRNVSDINGNAHSMMADYIVLMAQQINRSL